MSGGFGSLVAVSSKERSRHDNRNHRNRQHRWNTGAASRPRRRAVVLAANDKANAAALALELGELARAASVEDAIAQADVVVFAVWLDTTKELIARDAPLLENKVVVDPSNPLGFDESGQMIRTLPEGQSAGSVVADLLPAGAHYVKAFGTLGADALASSANREPRRAVLLYATDDHAAATTIERLIHAAGLEPLKVGGVGDAGRIEMPGGDPAPVRPERRTHRSRRSACRGRGRAIRMTGRIAASQ
jgi:8-hydroxy-5-deazaflavin:NADPH oxidoreductase